MQNATQLFTWIAGGFAVLGLLFVLSAIGALRRRRPLGFATRSLAALLLIVCAALAGTLSIATLGYQALTREEVAARVTIEPTGPQQFVARFRFADGREASYPLAGDQVYVDARVLKWKPIANLVGLHTAYQLDRVTGRYAALEKERDGPRTVHALGHGTPLDLFDLRTRYAALAPLLDVEYGSATFAPADRRAEYEVRVSTTGLLIRPAQPASS
ncbi:MAG: cation/multidrug efflux pump [Burkholderiales bacterium]|nr:cation/multidrug efflux pump [Burkholderiales bacterium]